MKQYIDKSAVVAELNRLIAELVEEGEDTMFEQGRISAFENAKLFLDTLEVKEEPISEDLEEAAKKAGQKYFPDENNIWARPNYETKAAEYAFKDGAKWQKEQLIDKACSFLHHYQEYPNHDIATDKLVEAFKMYIEL